ncbi:sel1 repeat family protein [Xenorhabdus sp. M]|uniref:Sel1 repeat family protein n=1 Tax=Xenorhabdus szentirmaii TaxID=290112 RepID=A0AAW3YW81_9GAMM|nr:tetratricopeptide repeat protein [Xenorhabdus sp. M]MBD2801762.1 sel1 repeat family protein [Xenorhabdus sp. M]
MSEEDLIKLAVKLDREEKNHKEAAKYYFLAAEKVNTTALNNLGILYEFGQGVEQDYAKSFMYYNKAVELDNNHTSLHNLAGLYLYGWGVKKNKEKALELLKKSADLGNKSAMSDLYWLTHPESKHEYE